MSDMQGQSCPGVDQLAEIPCGGVKLRGRADGRAPVKPEMTTSRDDLHRARDDGEGCVICGVHALILYQYLDRQHISFNTENSEPTEYREQK